MKSLFYIALLLGALSGAALSTQAQMSPPPVQTYQPLSDSQLDQLVGPIALYPDPLIAQILAAATLPYQIVLADRYVSGGGDPNLIDQQPWDASVRALARYPSVLQWMDQNLEWTTELGQAFLYQQQDVMNSVQRLRQSAYNLGNLQSTPQQQVNYDNGYIEIVPVNPQVVYVPVYQPAQVFYVAAYGAPFITFGIGYPIGWWLNCDFDWRNRNIIVWNHDHPRPANWWHEPSHRWPPSHTTVWHPPYRPGPVEMNRGDHGWGQPAHGEAPANRRIPVPEPRKETPVFRPPVNEHPAPAPVERPAPASRPQPVNRPQPANRPEPVNRPEPSGAFIGIQSSHDTKTFSDRGQQSMQTVPHSAPPAPVPASRPAPAPAPAPGGGGGSHGPRH
jgi:hypothetical protein